jgi:hypothetical protein
MITYKRGRKGILYSYYEDVVVGTIRLINKKLYFADDLFVGGYGYRRIRWKLLDLTSFIKGS